MINIAFGLGVMASLYFTVGFISCIKAADSRYSTFGFCLSISWGITAYLGSLI